MQAVKEAAAVCQGRREAAPPPLRAAPPPVDAADDGAATGKRAEGRRGGERVGGALSSLTAGEVDALEDVLAGRDRRRFGLINYGKIYTGWGSNATGGEFNATNCHIHLHTLNEKACGFSVNRARTPPLRPVQPSRIRALRRSPPQSAVISPLHTHAKPGTHEPRAR